MGFWSKLFGKKNKKLDLASVQPKFNLYAVDADGDGKVQDGTIWERPASLAVDLDKTIEKAEELLKAVAPNQDLKISEDLEKKRKRQAAAQKAALTRAANKAAKEAELAKQIAEKTATKKPAPKINADEALARLEQVKKNAKKRK